MSNDTPRPPLDAAARAALTAARRELPAVGRALWARGFASATSGNFSLRLGDGAMAVTASGRDKSELVAEDVLAVDLDGAMIDPPAGKPSAETLLHGQIYRRFAAAQAVLHVHSPAGTAMSRLFERAGEVRLGPWEMQKAFDGVMTHEHGEVVPIVANSQDIGALARVVGERLDRLPGAHGYLIAGHGLYTWGRSLAEAKRHVEAFEFLFDVELRLLAAQGGLR